MLILRNLGLENRLDGILTSKSIINIIKMINISVSIPETLLQQIEESRGEVNRSRFIKKLLQLGYQQYFDKKGGNYNSL